MDTPGETTDASVPDQDRVGEIAFAIPRMAATLDREPRELLREMQRIGMLTIQEHEAVLALWRETG